MARITGKRGRIVKTTKKRTPKRPGRAGVTYNLNILLIILLACIGVVFIRYFIVQIIEGDELSERMQKQISSHYSLQSPRGEIRDRHGRPLAISAMTKSLFVDPAHVENPEKLARELSPLIDVPEEEILADIEVGGGFSWVKRRLDQDEYERVASLIKSEGYVTCLGFRDEAKRYYPNDVLAANVLGFVGVDDKGLDGIEQAMDPYIKGEIKETTLVTDRSDTPIFDSVFQKHRYNGDYCKNIELTVDMTIQFLVEQELDKAMATTRPHAVTCIVMDPKTGDVLAMANRPGYNPNRFYDYSPELWTNRAVSFNYEPGSTFKAVVAGAALEEKIVTPWQYFVDPGYIMVSGRRIQNWNSASFGTITFTDVVKNSVNTAFAQIGLELGGERLMAYAKRFGFGDYTGIDLPGEGTGLLFEPEDMVDSDMATTAIGQSIAVTPIQLVSAMSAIANGGTLLKPHIVKRIYNADGSVYKEYNREEVRRVLTPDVDKELVGMLEAVVSSGGGGKAKITGYRIAGKTGTAQKIRHDGAGYMEGRYIASFCGFAPVEDPAVCVLVIIDDPLGIFYGGQIAAPLAGNVFAKLFRYMKIPPSSGEALVDTSKKLDE